MKEDDEDKSCCFDLNKKRRKRKVHLPSLKTKEFGVGLKCVLKD